ncbi:MAG: glycoside hydrolase family 3 C-terminal domain-containing protein [Melioribacteraceae bacterium]|nr:glycoside hydrolase family 3 C-terminal domain-containing protein [Melioribacteraceae bacterium]MCF8393881.1 glycoside hydrolase family 3 C-terminal domain-containing protein [Melioribacteraceae bacterium]MCF8419653.1 glycoside hydrolase family 3 C-terminal domain-containing protein [Melioribacteraceae bacterium]
MISIMYLGFAVKTDEQISDEKIDKRIDAILSKMTIEEKVGQMTQITLEVISSREGEASSLVIDADKLKEAIVDYKVGSIINTGGAANTLDDWQEIITSIQDAATKETRLGIPVLYGIDAIHGANYTLGATLFPQAINLAASRNKEIVKEGGSITAYEVRASGIPWNFNPVLGMGREPLWARFWETFGEDVHLTTEMGKAYVEGQQGKDISDKTKVATCIKHYMGYSVPKNGKDRTPAWIPERFIRDIFLPPFAEAVKTGAFTAMVNSSEVNGIPAHSDYHILTEILKGELNLKGFIVSDWEDIIRLHTRDRVAESPEEAVKMAVMAGLDMSMVPYDYSFYEILVKLVKDGEVPESRIDDAVRRILLVKYMLGLFENPYPYTELSDGFASEEFTEANLNAARESITLVKNENNILPLSKTSKVLVAGPTANLLSVMNGGWTITWQGNNEELYPKEKHTILEAVQEKIGENNVIFREGSSFEEDINSAEAVKMAEKVDAVVLCLGEPTYCETPGNISDLALPDAQLMLAQELAKAGKPIVLVMVEGRPRVINKIVDHAEGIVVAMLPGMEGGRAVADILFGDVNPSAKLPFTYPRNVNGYMTYDYKPLEVFDVNEFNPQWSFGHGLSYTEFEYSDLKLSGKNFSVDDEITVSVTVKNIGDREGKEAVELYITDLYGSVTRPNKQLKAFEKINLAPGESQEVSFTLNSDDLSFIGRENTRIVEPGEFIAAVADLQAAFYLK